MSATADQDRSFDGLAERFEQRIYGSLKGQLREQLLWWHMQKLIPELNNQVNLNILDAAGGLGQMTGKLLALDHYVCLNDISSEMLQRAQQRLQQQASQGLLLNRLSWHQGPIQSLARHKEGYDLIVCHALLEWLAEPEQTLKQLLTHLKPGGLVSLAFYNRHALAIKNAHEGNLNYLLPGQSRRKPKRKGLSPPNAQFPEQVFTWFEGWGWQQRGYCGIRVMVDWMPDTALSNSNPEQLLAIEQHYCEHLPYALSGRYVHAVFQKPI